MSTSPPVKKCKLSTSPICSPEKLDKLFEGLSILVVENNIGKIRFKILQKQIVKHGGSSEKTISSKTSHLIVNKNLKKEMLLKILKVKIVDAAIKIVDADWLSSCLMKGFIVDEALHQVYVVDDELDERNTASSNVKVSVTVNKQLTSYQELIELKDKLDFFDEERTDVNETSTLQQSSVWACATPSRQSGSKVNHNKFITDKLEILERSYTSTQDRWRAVGYKKAISSIKNYHRLLQTYDEVQSLPFVGERLAKKIWEIIETGHLRRLDFVDPKVQLLAMFSKVWGAGPKTAEMWVALGYKSLDDLKDADLNFQQKIGLQYYNDINERMSRDEVEEIRRTIVEVAEQLLPNVLLVVCGSFRRGRATCGDIDVLVSHPDNKSHYGFLSTLLDRLKELNLITHDLITVKKVDQHKYMGLIKLPGDHRKQRRIDFIVTPYDEWSCALMHFTGSAHFNRSIRLLAKKKNMSLSEHALRTNVVRPSIKGEEKLNKGTVVTVSSEKYIFTHLGLDYLEPADRDW